MKRITSLRVSRFASAALAVGLITSGLVLRPLPAGANYNDPIIVGFATTDRCGGGYCATPDETSLTGKHEWAPYSTLFVHNAYVDGTDPGNGPQPAGYGITGLSDDGTGVYGWASGNDPAIVARNDSGPGLHGNGIYAVSGYGDGVFSTTNGIEKSGVYGENLGGQGYGVVGRTNASARAAVWGDNIGGGNGVEGDTSGANNGVYGHAHNTGGSGVYGQNDGTGYGVAGRAISTNGGTGVLGDAPIGTKGIGVEADSAHGTALQVNGKAKFSRSGVVTVPAGSSSQPVTLPGVNSNSMILATAQQATSISVRAAVPAVPSAGSFTIYLSGNAPAGGLKVAYFVLN
jgi:hypothetical protein